MSDDDYGDIQLIDTDNIQFGNKEQEFNHQSLVMKSYNITLDALSKEMIEGFWTEKKDKFGNSLYIKTPDTRKEAIQCVKTLKSVMIADIMLPVSDKKQKEDKANKKVKLSEYEEKIRELEKNEQDIKDKYSGQQHKWLQDIGTQRRNAIMLNYGIFESTSLNEKLPFNNRYLNDAVDIYRKIFEQLELCLADKRYFKRKTIIG